MRRFVPAKARERKSVSGTIGEERPRSTSTNLAKLAGGNVLRVMRQAEAVAASMRRTRGDVRRRHRPMSDPPLRAAIIPVTPLQQNCSLLWCTQTMRGAFVDPGGDLPRLKAAAAQAGVTVEKIC